MTEIQQKHKEKISFSSSSSSSFSTLHEIPFASQNDKHPVFHDRIAGTPIILFRSVIEDDEEDEKD